MKNRKIVLSKIFMLIILAIMVFSCTPDTNPSLYKSNYDKGIPSEIISVSPESGYSGVTTITITGKNFSPVLEENSVYFSSKKAQILSGSTTELVVKAPIISGDSVRIYTKKVGVEDYSNTYYYKLGSAVSEYYSFVANQEPYVATIDLVGNIYFSYIESTVGKGIYKIDIEGALSEFAPKGGETFFNDLKYHSDGYLVGVYGNKAIFKIESGVKPAVLINTNNNSIKLNSFDFDKNKNIWAAGKGGFIVGAKPDKSFKLFEYTDEISGLRVFNDYLYAISGEDNNQNIVRFPIIYPDSIGTVETYFPFSSNVPVGVVANSLTFAADGQMYIATTPLSTNSDPIDPIMYVNTDGSFGTWYPGLITSGVSSFTWGSGTELFVIRDRFPNDRAVVANPGFGQSILKIDMERLGAPDYGRN
ncbi:MAG: IPT/TIG domain-containing protein [Bacteroidetes bacterium]|nr:IPT/TIG domain-containing protein [Bacteroidota bacterium]MBU1114727.1 IPT/TIG domain-containing protein [Bacteroidota bacterium]MBU1798929.1 IPT/TIG domain-containing protein [Bacteroidota bacterium]